MKKANMIALLAMFLTASVTFATANFQASHDDPPVFDCWSDDLDRIAGKDPDMTLNDCDGQNVFCCYDENGIAHSQE